MTIFASKKSVAVGYFNSHPHEEDDAMPAADLEKIINFNSHPHEEDDGNPEKNRKEKRRFQLTSSRRG